jgi:hypothetical protein
LKQPFLTKNFMMRKNWIGILTIGMALGTAWAVRGQFGHEQGAAWAGGIGGLFLVLASGRKDWFKKVFTIALSCAVGWGTGGMISYGRVVGFGRSDHFPNVFYGLLMLFVIGALFGFLGGGFTALSLHSTGNKKVKWGSLLAEMAGGGAIGYYLLVNQLNILMTPPRSEAWAVILGAGLAMLWHMARNNYTSPLRVAFITAIGAGFGFSFGNFLQTVGGVLEINFNMWNVMEYSIGFFGGTSMAYGIFTSKWPNETDIPAKWESRTAFLVIMGFIPLIVFRQSLQYNKLLSRLGEQASTESILLLSSSVAAILMIAMIIAGALILTRSKISYSRNDIMKLTVTYFIVYIAISYIVTGALIGKFHLNHHLYVVNFLVIFYLLNHKKTAEIIPKSKQINSKLWLTCLMAIILIILLLALISISIHNGLSGAQYRFPLKS